MRPLATIFCNILTALRFIPCPAFTTRFIADHPDPEDVAEGCIYVVGGRGYRKWAYFRCPADQNEIVQLSLMLERRPRWTVAADWLGRPTIVPSVRKLDGSYAHFWIKKGAVIWCSDSGHKPGRTA